MKKPSFWIKLAVSIAFFAILARHVRGHDFVAMLKQVDLCYFLLSFALMAGMISASCLKWALILKYQGRPLRFGFLMKTYMIGYYFSNLLPSNVGGDVARAYYVGRHLKSYSTAAISVFIERFSGICFLLLLVIAAPLFVPSLYARPCVAIPACGALALLGLVAVLATRRSPLAAPRRLTGRLVRGVVRASRSLHFRAGARMGERLEQWLDRLFEKLEGLHDKLAAALRSLRENRGALLGVVALTVLFYALTWLNVYLAFLTFGERPAFTAIAALTPVIMFISMIPISLGSLGLAESAFVFYFALAGIAPAASLAVGLFLRLKMIAAGLVGFVVYLGYKGRPSRLPAEPTNQPEK